MYGGISELRNTRRSFIPGQVVLRDEYLHKVMPKVSCTLPGPDVPLLWSETLTIRSFNSEKVSGRPHTQYLTTASGHLKKCQSS
jgi:hypothetical protein